MAIKLMGAALVLMACGGCGITVAFSYRREIQQLKQLLHILQYMRCDLPYRLTPLPELCRSAADNAGGSIKQIFLRAASELEQQTIPDLNCCFQKVLTTIPVTRRIEKLLRQIAATFGQFDLNGQLNALDAVCDTCRASLTDLSEHQEERTRSYHTLGLCAGAALVILFI